MKKSEGMKRLLSFLLVFSIMLSYVPVSTQAAEGDACTVTADCAGSYADGFCTVCGEAEPQPEPEHIHMYDGEPQYGEKDDSVHTVTRVCTSCEEQPARTLDEAHSYTAGVCACGKTEPMDEAVEAVKTQVAALPAVEAAKAMSNEELGSWNDPIQAAYDSYKVLSEEQKNRLIAEGEKLMGLVMELSSPERVAPTADPTGGEDVDDAAYIVSYVPTQDGSHHVGIYSARGTQTVELEHTFDPDTHTCVCGMVEPGYYTLTVSASPAEGGTVTGADIYQEKTFVAVNAAAANGYTFVNWTQNGEEVSTSEMYIVLVTKNIDLVANFAQKDPLTLQIALDREEYSNQYTVATLTFEFSEQAETGWIYLYIDGQRTGDPIYYSGYLESTGIELADKNLSNGNHTIRVEYIPTGEETGIFSNEVTFSYQAPVKYPITIPETIVGGTVTVDKTEAFAGDKVWITAEANADYDLVYIRLLEDTFIIYPEGENLWSFVMPAKAVEICVEFLKKVIPVEHTGENAETTYDGSAYDVSTMFTLDPNAGSASYAIIGGTGEGDMQGSRLTVTKAGTFQVKVSTEINGRYNAGEAVATLTVNKAEVQIPEIASKPYTGEKQTADVPASDWYTVTANNGGIDKGSYDVVLTLHNANNYTWHGTEDSSVTVQFAITTADNHWVVEPSIVGWTYGEAPNAVVAQPKFGETIVEYKLQNESEEAYTTTVPTNAGTYDVRVSVSETSNYKGITDIITLVIAKSEVQIPEIASKPYTGEKQTADVPDSDLYTVTANNGGINKGSYDVVLTLTDAAHYTWPGTEESSVTVQFAITTADNYWVVEPSIEGWTYGEESNPVVAQPRFGDTKVEYKLRSEGNDAYTTTVPTNAGTYDVRVKAIGGGNGSYPGITERITLVIAKAELLLSAVDMTVTYGDEAPEYAAEITGLVNGDSLEDLELTCEYQQYDDAGEYAITPGGFQSTNYNVTVASGTLTVNPKPITVIIHSKTSVFGEPIAELTASADGIVNGDTDVYRLTTEATSTSGVGKYDITGETLDDNYTITFENGLDAYVITNVHESEIWKTHITKIWKDNNSSKRPNSVTVRLYKNGIPYGKSFKITESNNWRYPVELPVYENGRRIHWRVQEEHVPLGYDVSYNQSSLTITNRLLTPDTNPGTGDDFNLGLWSAVMGTSAIGILMFLLLGKKKKSGKTNN